MNPIGIMSGRLSPPLDNELQTFPRSSWAAEFPRAASAGIETIEWIYDHAGGESNPLVSAEGIARIRQLSADHGVAVRSCCADYFMDFPLVRCGSRELADRLHHLDWLIRQCATAGIERVVLPFVDRSAIHRGEESSVRESLIRAAETAGQLDVELHLETDLSPARFGDFLDGLPEQRVKVTYDSGNSAALGFDSADEFAAYGSRIGSVHIKDRELAGHSTALGSGAVDFTAVFGGLSRLGYQGDLILQTARTRTGAEEELARSDRRFLQRLMREAG